MARYCPYCVSRVDTGDTCPYCNYAYTYRRKPHHLAPGTILNNKYLLGRSIGEGGFGITYVGRDLTLDMKVAIKEYYPADKSARVVGQSNSVSLRDWSFSDDFKKGREQFITEAQTIAKMDKESAVVTVRDFFKMNNSAYIVMEFIEGQDLRDIINTQKKPMDKKELLNLLEPVFRALGELHQMGLIHRDISPDNIMVEKGRARLIDFGCARKTLDMENSDTVLKHSFSPIEQYENRNMGPWTDVYAMAATIYYCLTGRRPPTALERSVKDELVPPSALGVKLLPKQERALMKALAVNREDRFQSMNEFGKALFVHTNLYKYIAIAAVGVAVIAVAAFLLFQPETKVEALKTANEVTYIYTADDELSAEEKAMLQAAEELLSSASLNYSEYDYTYLLSLENNTDYDFSSIRFNTRLFGDSDVIVSNSWASGSIELKKGSACSLKTNSSTTSAARGEVKAFFDHGDKTYSTAFCPVSIAGGDKDVTEFELINSLPQTFTYTDYKGEINSYTITDFYSTVRGGSAFLSEGLHFCGTMDSGKDHSTGRISYKITDEAGAVVESGELYLGPLDPGDAFDTTLGSTSFLTVGQKYYVELVEYVSTR